MSASNLLISFYDAPQAFSLNECLDVIVELSNIGASTATGTNYIFFNLMNGWTYNWNPSQTTSTTIFDEVIAVNNSQWSFQAITLGQSYLAGYQFSTSEALSPAETIRFALQICAPNSATSRTMSVGILKNSQGDNTSGNNSSSLSITSS